MRAEGSGGEGQGEGQEGRNQLGKLSLNPLKTIPGGVYPCPHSTDKDTEVGRERQTCPRLHVTKSTVKPGTM